MWKQLYFSSECCLKPKKNFFFGRVGARKFWRANAPKKLLLDSHSIFVSIRNRHISSFTGNQFFTFILKKMKVFYARYETFLHTFTSNFVRQVLPKFLPLNCGRKITDFKEWSKIRVCCFFWQIELGKNKEFWTQSNEVETNFTFQANAVWSQAKDFSSALARQNLPKVRGNADVICCLQPKKKAF